MSRRKLTTTAVPPVASRRRGPVPRGGGQIKRPSVRLSAGEYERTLALAEKRGVTVSDVLRDALLREIGETD